MKNCVVRKLQSPYLEKLQSPLKYGDCDGNTDDDYTMNHQVVELLSDTKKLKSAPTKFQCVTFPEILMIFRPKN